MCCKRIVRFRKSLGCLPLRFSGRGFDSRRLHSNGHLRFVASWPFSLTYPESLAFPSVLPFNQVQPEVQLAGFLGPIRREWAASEIAIRQVSGKLTRQHTRGKSGQRSHAKGERFALQGKRW